MIQSHQTSRNFSLEAISAKLLLQPAEPKQTKSRLKWSNCSEAMLSWPLQFWDTLFDLLWESGFGQHFSPLSDNRSNRLRNQSIENKKSYPRFWFGLSPKLSKREPIREGYHYRRFRKSTCSPQGRFSQKRWGNLSARFAGEWVQLTNLLCLSLSLFSSSFLHVLSLFPFYLFSIKDHQTTQLKTS